MKGTYHSVPRPRVGVKFVGKSVAVRQSGKTLAQWSEQYCTALNIAKQDKLPHDQKEATNVKPMRNDQNPHNSKPEKKQLNLTKSSKKNVK